MGLMVSVLGYRSNWAQAQSLAEITQLLSLPRYFIPKGLLSGSYSGQCQGINGYKKIEHFPINKTCDRLESYLGGKKMKSAYEPSGSASHSLSQFL